MKLSPEAEEVATFFAKMLDHEYTTKDIFRKNFFKDWRKVWREKILDFPTFFTLEISISDFFVLLLQEMTSEERGKISDLKKCNFSEMNEYFKAQSEARKAMTKDEKLVSRYVFSLSVRSLPSSAAGDLGLNLLDDVKDKMLLLCSSPWP